MIIVRQADLGSTPGSATYSLGGLRGVTEQRHRITPTSQPAWQERCGENIRHRAPCQPMAGAHHMVVTSLFLLDNCPRSPSDGTPALWVLSWASCGILHKHFHLGFGVIIGWCCNIFGDSVSGSVSWEFSCPFLWRDISVSSAGEGDSRQPVRVLSASLRVLLSVVSLPLPVSLTLSGSLSLSALLLNQHKLCLTPCCL